MNKKITQGSTVKSIMLNQTHRKTQGFEVTHESHKQHIETSHPIPHPIPDSSVIHPAIQTSFTCIIELRSFFLTLVYSHVFIPSVFVNFYLSSMPFWAILLLLFLLHLIDCPVLLCLPDVSPLHTFLHVFDCWFGLLRNASPLNSPQISMYFYTPALFKTD